MRKRHFAFLWDDPLTHHGDEVQQTLLCCVTFWTEVTSGSGRGRVIMSQGVILYGDTTRELYGAWHARVGSTATLPQDQVQPLFNDLCLFPSTSQVFEMLHCARECSKRNQENFITFGEFCVFATELRKYYASHERDPSTVVSQPVQVSKMLDKRKKGELRTQRSTTSSYDVFLGGSCNPTTWRQDAAIPHLKSQGITFYNPQQANWVPEMIELEHQAKYSSQIMFYVLNEQTRNVASMVEVCQFAGSNRRLVVVLSSYPTTGLAISGEPVTKAEYEELQNGIETCQDLIERQGIPVFTNIDVALNCTSKVLKENLSIEELGLKDQAQPVRLAHIQIGDKLIRLREAFDTLDTARTGKLSLAEIKMAFRIHAHRDLTGCDLRAICSSHGVNAPLTDLPLDRIYVSFDEFCSLVSEYKNKVRDSHHHQQQRSHAKARDSVLTRTVHFFTTTLVQPVKGAAAWIAAASLSVASSSSSPRSRTFSGGGAGAAMGRRGSAVRDVYLGGSSQAGWREQLAIPMLKKSGLTFYNPAVCSSRRLIPIEASAMDNSRVLLFAILGDSRCLAAMCQAAYLIGLGCNVVLCVQHLPPDARIAGEALTPLAVKDYNRGRAYLSDFANREGIPVFDELQEALECVIVKCKSSSK